MFDLGCGDRRPAVTKTASRVDASCVVLPFTSNTSGGSGGRSPPETVTNVEDYEPTEEIQTRKGRWGGRRRGMARRGVVWKGERRHGPAAEVRGRLPEFFCQGKNVRRLWTEVGGSL